MTSSELLAHYDSRYYLDFVIHMTYCTFNNVLCSQYLVSYSGRAETSSVPSFNTATHVRRFSLLDIVTTKIQVLLVTCELKNVIYFNMSN